MVLYKALPLLHVLHISVHVRVHGANSYLVPRSRPKLKGKDLGIGERLVDLAGFGCMH